MCTSAYGYVVYSSIMFGLCVWIGSEYNIIFSSIYEFYLYVCLGLRRVNMSLCIGLGLSVYGLCLDLGCVYHGIYHCQFIGVFVVEVIYYS